MKPGVLLVDDDDDLLEAMAELVEEFAGRPVVKAHSVAELESVGEAALASDVAIMDINLGPDAPSGLEALHWLLDRHYAGRVVFLTGHAAGFPLVEQARRMKGVQVVSKPIGCERLLDLLRSPR
jgi:DNA-binding NtrC family response regulator